MTANGRAAGAPEPVAPKEIGIAIIGMACVFPQAPDLHAFWRNIMQKVDTIGDPPANWEAQRYLDSGRIKTPSGGYLKDLFHFDPRPFGIMPNSLDGGEPDQFLALRVARDALADAGYLPENHDHKSTGIVLGHSTYLHRGQGTLIQSHIVLDQTIELLRVMCPELDESRLQQAREVLARRLPPSNADIAPGFVPNVMTGRIANRLNFKGPNYLIDAACSSSLLAVGAAMDELRAGRSDMMLAGGVNASLPAEVTVIFTQLGALSGRGKVRPFDTGSDGTLLGEGLGMVVLKRLDDALASGDRVYAVLRGVGQASDGRGQGLLAPSVEGEALAIRRAYSATGIDPASVGLIEAHGTGIPLGDRTEIASLAMVFGTRQTEQASVALGSVKSMISHCIPAAGVAGLIKASLALHHRVLPPTLCDEVNPALELEKTPFFVNTEAAPWIHSSAEPRRAGIDSFGFGGINTHAVVEEAPAAAQRPRHSSPWPAELCLFSAPSDGELVAKVEALSTGLALHPEWTLAEIAAALHRTDKGEPHRLALVATDRASLDKALAQALKKLKDPAAERWSMRSGVAYSRKPLGGKLGFVFPGEGSQYPGMYADLALCFEEIRGWLDFWCGLYPDAPGARRTDIAFPPSTGLSPAERAALEHRLHDMDVGSEAVFVGGRAMHSLLLALGVEPDAMLGHSSGESTALGASGAIAVADRAELGEFIRRLNGVYQQALADGKIATGALLTVGALPFATVEELARAVDPSIAIAMDNCKNQIVLYGTPAAIATLQEKLTAESGICMLLPFDRGYHTAAFAGVTAAFHDYYRSIGLTAPKLPLYSCASVGPFPSEPQAIQELAAAQWSARVRFRETVLRMHADGVRTFVEVGPSGNLTAFINDILAGKEYFALATNLRRRGGVDQLLTVLAQLYVEARPLALTRLFETRAITELDLAAGPAAPRGGVLLDNTMPKIRLGEADLASLRALIGGARAAAIPAVLEHNAPPSTPPLSGQDEVVAALASVESPGVDEAAPWPYAAFLDELIEHDAEHVVAISRPNVQRDAFLRDHVLSGPVSAREPDLLGLACVPMMVSLEIMAQACALLAGTPAVRVIENVAAFAWIALDDGEVTLEVRARLVDASTGLYSASLSSGGATIMTADFRFQTHEHRCAALASLSEYRESLWNDQGLYECGMFHGPVFQSIQHIDGWDDHGIDAQLSTVALRGFFAEGEQPALVLNPVLLDAMGQLAAYWIAQYAGTDFNCFPSTIERIELYADCPEDLPGARLLARQRPLDPAVTDASAPRAWDFECLDGEGRPLVRMTNLLNVYFPVPHRFYEVRRDPKLGWLGQPTEPAGPEGVMLWELPLLSDDFCSRSSGIFLRILAHIYLDFAEREEWRALTGNVRRKREWLLGRACIKEAVRYWIYQRTGELLHSTDVVVLHDERGAPSVGGSWAGQLLDAPEVSLSHDNHACLVAVADAASRVGVDREELGRVQRPELVAEALSPKEQALLAGLDGAALQDRLLRIWCAKEAAAKCLGVGLNGSPEAFEVTFADAECLSGHVEHAEHAGTPVYVDIVRQSTSVIALASAFQRETQ